MPQVFVETVTARVGNYIAASRVRPATDDEVRAAMQDYIELGLCAHELVCDEHGWLYDVRYCAICGVGRGSL